MLGSKTTPHFQQFRLPRYSTEGFEDTLVEIRPANAPSVVAARPLNYSKYGLAFEVRETPALRLNGVRQIDRLTFKAFGKTFFEGNVSVKHIRENEGKFVIGVFTGDRAIDVEEVLGARIAYQIIHGRNGYSKIAGSGKTNEAYQLVVAQFRDYLKNTKNSLDATEKEIAAYQKKDQDKIGRSVLVSLENAFREKSDFYLKQIFNICKNLSEEELTVYKKYFQDHLHDLILLCPFGRRCVDKPLGYSGDYEVMNMIYGDHYLGDSLFAKLENQYWCSIPPARANMDRLNYLKSKIKQTAERVSREGRKAKITSLGSGPAKEIYDFIENSGLSENCVFTCVDLEPKALEYSKQTLTEITLKKYRNVQLNFVLANVVSYFRADPQDFMRDQDLIYASGLFDYLKESVAQKLINEVGGLIGRGGELLIVNASTTNPYKIGIEFAGEWYLNHRDEENMVKLTSGCQFGSKNLFLDREKVYWFFSLAN